MQNINNNIVTGLVIIVAALLLYLLFLALRKPVLAKLGVRNIPRRPTQSILIVIGLTLSTIIIVSALSIGDTLSYSVQRHAVEAYGAIDEIIAPPILSQLASLAENSNVDATATTTNTTQAELDQLMAGGLTSVLTILEGGLPGISTARYEQLRAEAAEEPLIDAVASSILFPTIIRNVSTGQGEPLGIVFAVDADYDQQFGLTNVEGEPVQMESLQPGVGNIFKQASNLFALAQTTGANLLGDNFSISEAALTTAAVGAALTAGAASGAADQGLDLADISIPITTVRSLGIDTTLLEQQGITRSLSLSALGITTSTLASIGVNTTTVGLEDIGIDTSAVQTVTNNLLGALNLNTLGTELDRVLAQFGLQLRQGDVYLSALGADRLDARVGDVLEIYVGPIPIPFRVKGIVAEAGPLGAVLPVVMMRLDEAQQLFFMNDKVNNVLVSNLGDDLGGMVHTEAVSQRLKVLALDPDAVQRVVEILRRPAVRKMIDTQSAQIQEQIEEDIDAPPIIAALVQSFAGMEEYAESIRSLPAALDQTGTSDELRTLLANTDVRQWLTEQRLPVADATELESALSALNQFDVPDPLNKATVVQVANVGGTVFSSIFSLFGIFSILAGVMLIFLIFVMLAAERRSEMGMARAIGVQRSHLVQMFVTEGVLYDLAAAALGVALGLGISYLMVGFIGGIFNDVSSQLGVSSAIFRFYFHVQPSSIIIAYCLGVLLTFIVVTVASYRVSRLNIVSAIRGLPEEANAKTRSLLTKIWRWLLGPLLAAGGIYLFFVTWGDGQTNILMGVSLILAGGMILVGRLLDRTRLRAEPVQRLVYTVIGLGLLITWALPWDTILGRSSSILDQNSPLFLVAFALRAPMIILGAIMTVMFNADALSWFFSRLLGGIGALTPVLKTAIAYPLSARFRTGMAMVMFAMIICTVVIMAVVIEATQSLIVLDAKESAGFEIETSPTLLSFFDPITDLEARIAAQTEYDLSGVAVVGAAVSQNVQAREVVTPSAGMEWGRVKVVGVNPGYLQQAEQVYHFQLRAPGYADDAAIWQALRERDDVAIVTPDIMARVETADTNTPDPDSFDPDNFDDEGGGRRPLRLNSFTLASATLPEVFLEMQGTDTTGADVITHRVQIIGVLDDDSTLAGGRVQMSLPALQRLSSEPVNPDSFYVKVAEGADVQTVARELERAFLSSGLDATIMAESFAAGQSVTRGILQLFQGFMALGLLVGIAALGVISSRTVVERRQQVGMLRAIGYQARMVAFSFLLESSFIAITGILIGAVAGLILGQNMVAIFFTDLTPDTNFALPWLQIGVILLLAYGFSLLTTILPAYQAARIYPAEALRYE